MAVSVTQRAVYSEPSNLEQRNRLARLIMRCGGNKEDEEESLSSFSLSVAGSSALSEIGDVQALIEALHMQSVALASRAAKEGNSVLVEALRKAQRSVLLRPWEVKGWQTLAYVRSKT